MDCDERTIIHRAGFYCTRVMLHGDGDWVSDGDKATRERPFSEVIIYRDRTEVQNNYAIIKLVSECQSADKKIYQTALKELPVLGAKLISGPPSFEVSDYRHVAGVVDWLFRHNHMTEAGKEKLDSSIVQLKIFAEFAASDPKEREKLQTVLSIYVQELMGFSSDVKSAGDWLKIMIDVCGRARNEDEAFDGFWACFNEVRPDNVTLEAPLYALADFYCYPEKIAALFEEGQCPRLTYRVVRKIIWDSVNEYKPKGAKVFEADANVFLRPSSGLQFVSARTYVVRGMNEARTKQERALEDIKDLAEYNECSFRDALKKLSQKPAATCVIRPSEADTSRVVISFVNGRGQIEHVRLKVSSKGKVSSGPRRLEDVQDYVQKKLFMIPPKKQIAIASIKTVISASRIGRVEYGVSHVVMPHGATYICARSPTDIGLSVWKEDAAAVVQLSGATNRLLNIGDGITVEYRDEQLFFAGPDDKRSQGLSFRKVVLKREFERKTAQQFTFEMWEEGEMPNIDLMMRLINEVDEKEKPIVIQSTKANRAGLFVLLHHLTRLLERGEGVNIQAVLEETVKGFSDPNMVLTREQYQYVEGFLTAHFRRDTY